MDAAKVEIRETTLEEKDAVLAVSHYVYDGMDHLPFHYHKFVTDPNVTSLAAFVDGTPVAYNAGQVVDGGTTLVVRAARVKDEYKGKGVYGRLSKDTVSVMQQRLPGLKREVIATNDTNFAANKQRLLRRYTHLETRSCHWFTAETACNATPSESPKVSVTSSLDLPDLHALFLKPEARTLFPNGRIILNWVPFRPQACNFHEDFYHTLLVLHDEKPLTEKRQNNDDKLKKDHGDEATSSNETEELHHSGEVTLITFGSWYVPSRPSSLCYYVDAYGTDLALLRRHVETHLQRARKLAGDLGLASVVLTLCCEQSLPSESVLELAALLGLKEHEIYIKTMSLLERELGAE